MAVKIGAGETTAIGPATTMSRGARGTAILMATEIAIGGTAMGTTIGATGVTAGGADMAIGIDAITIATGISATSRASPFSAAATTT